MVPSYANAQFDCKCLQINVLARQSSKFWQLNDRSTVTPETLNEGMERFASPTEAEGVISIEGVSMFTLTVKWHLNANFAPRVDQRLRSGLWLGSKCIFAVLQRIRDARITEERTQHHSLKLVFFKKKKKKKIEWLKKWHLNFHRYRYADFLPEDNARVIVGVVFTGLLGIKFILYHQKRGKSSPADVRVSASLRVSRYHRTRMFFLPRGA